MNCPNCEMPETSRNHFECGSHLDEKDNIIESGCCRKISKLRDLLQDTLPYVRSSEMGFVYNDVSKSEIEDFVIRIENEVGE